MDQATEPQQSTNSSSIDMSLKPAAAPSQVYTAAVSDQPASPNSKKKFLFFGVVIVLLVFLFLTGGLLVYAGYSGSSLPLMNKDQKLAYQKLYADLPLVPKAPQHILLTTLGKKEMVTLYEQKTTAAVKIKPKGGEEANLSVPFTFVADGAFDVRDFTNPLYSIDFSAESGTTLLPFKAKMGLRQLDDKVYFQIREMSGILDNYISFRPVYNKWFVSTVLTPEEKQKLGSNPYNLHDTDKYIVKIFEDQGFAKTVVRLSDEKVSDEVSYHLKFTPRRSDVLSIIKAFAEEAGSPLSSDALKQWETSLNQVENIVFDLWIGKTSTEPRKMTLAFLFKPETSNNASYQYDSNNPLSLLQDATYDVSITTELLSINKPVEIKAPDNPLSVEEFTNLLREEQSSGSASRSAEINESL